MLDSVASLVCADRRSDFFVRKDYDDDDDKSAGRK